LLSSSLGLSPGNLHHYLKILSLKIKDVHIVFLGSGEGFQGSNPESCSARSRVADTESPLDRGCRVIIIILFNGNKMKIKD
jgi:hypothetical protein